MDFASGYTTVTFNPLAILVLLPLIGAAVAAFVKPKSARGWALGISLATLGVSLVTAFEFDYTNGSTQYMLAGPAVGSIGFSFSLGMDSISLWLVLLTTLLMPLAILSSFNSIKERQTSYYAWMQLLLAAMVGVFVAHDLVLFYIFFELTLIPMFFIIGLWGGPDRRFAAGKFFLFTFTGSVLTLAAAIYVGVKYGTFDIQALTEAARYGRTMTSGVFVPALTSTERTWVLLGFLAGFAVKVPLFPVHTWLPLAHTEAPTAGSVILAGVLLKLGTYGLLRLAVPIGMLSADGLAAEQLHIVRILGILCVIGIIYGALVAWVQQDIKKLVAYSSVSHLGFCVLGLIALNAQGVMGSILYMLNHGISTGAMFLTIGMIYDRYHTRDINQLSGLARRMPIMAFFFVLFVMASIGLPGTNGFISEFLTILGAFRSPFLGFAYGAFAATGIVLGAVYMLHMTAKVIFGPLKTPDLHHGSHDETDAHHDSTPGDLSAREIGILVPLALAVVVLGVAPLGLMNSMVEQINDIRRPVVQITDEQPGLDVSAQANQIKAPVVASASQGRLPTASASTPASNTVALASGMVGTTGR